MIKEGKKFEKATAAGLWGHLHGAVMVSECFRVWGLWGPWVLLLAGVSGGVVFCRRYT